MAALDEIDAETILTLCWSRVKRVVLINSKAVDETAERERIVSIGDSPTSCVELGNWRLLCRLNEIKYGRFVLIPTLRQRRGKRPI